MMPLLVSHEQFYKPYFSAKKSQKLLSVRHGQWQLEKSIIHFESLPLGDTGGKEMGIEFQEELQIPFIIQEIEF